MAPVQAPSDLHREVLPSSSEDQDLPDPPLFPLVQEILTLQALDNHSADRSTACRLVALSDLADTLWVVLWDLDILV